MGGIKDESPVASMGDDLSVSIFIGNREEMVSFLCNML